MIPPSRQPLGSNHNDTAQPQEVQVGAPPPPSVANLNIQADSISIAAILQAARSGAPSLSSGSIQADSIAITVILQAGRRGDSARQPEEDNHARNDQGNNDNGDNEDGEADVQLSPRKQKSPTPNDERIDSTHGRSRGNKIAGSPVLEQDLES